MKRFGLLKARKTIQFDKDKINEWTVKLIEQQKIIMQTLSNDL